MSTDPNQSAVDQQLEDAFTAAIQPGASLAEIDAFIELQQIVAEQEQHEAKIIQENE